MSNFLAGKKIDRIARLATRFWLYVTWKKSATCINKNSRSAKIDRILNYIFNGFMLLLMLSPEIAQADIDGTADFGGITEILKGLAKTVIYDWGFYIGIISLALIGFRWKTGHMSLADVGRWAGGIICVFFAPSIVKMIRDHAGSQL